MYVLVEGHDHDSVDIFFVVVSYGPGSLGVTVGARCGNGPFSTYKSPKFYLSFTILVSFILVRYPDRIG